MMKLQRGQHQGKLKKGCRIDMNGKNKATPETQQETNENWSLDRSLLKVLEKCGLLLTEKQGQEISEKVDRIFNYKPMVGVFGKTGVGKSSMCNALFGQDVCSIDDVEGCTRDAQTVALNVDGNEIHLIDVPGVGESEEQDELCEKLYAELLPKLDMVLWLVKADDRAVATDKAFYERVVRPAVEDQKPIFLILTQVDKMEPCREWNTETHEPGDTQYRNIHRKAELLSEEFGLRSNQVIPVSAVETYNLTKLVDEMIFALPAEQTFAVYRAVNGEYRSAESGSYVKRSIFDEIGEIVSSVYYGASLTVRSIGDALHDWWDDHQPWWWPI